MNFSLFGQSVPTSLAKIHKSLQQQSGHFSVPNWQCQHSGLGFTLCFGLQRWPAVSWHLSSLRAVHQGFSWTLNVANNRKCHQNVTLRIIARKTPKRVLGSVASCITRDVQIPAACAFGAAFALVLTHHRIIIPSIPSTTEIPADFIHAWQSSLGSKQQELFGFFARASAWNKGEINCLSRQSTAK